MTASIKLGRIWGIPIGLHSSWFLVFGLVTWSLAAGYFPGEYPATPVIVHWLLAAATSVLFFGSVLLHELGHTLLALRNGIPVRSINLFLFGGVAQIAREPSTAGAELRIAIAGPLTSLGLAAMFGGVWTLGQDNPYLAAPTVWLARINFSLALFNLIPGFPLDGGRVLRALVWQLTGSFDRASQVAVFTGELIAFGFITVGLFTIFEGSFFNGLWLVFIGWFLQNAAAASQAQANLQRSLGGVTAAHLMSREYSQVMGQIPIQQLIDDQILASGQRCFFVVEGDHLLGMLTLRDIARVPSSDRDKMTAEKAMVPLDRLTWLEPDTPLLAALQRMDDADVAQAPIMEEGRIVGMLSREQVLRYVRTRAELGM